MAEPVLPSAYAYGFVTARAIRAVADSTSADDPYPDGPPVAMDKAVTFRPLETGRIIPGASPEPSIRAQHEDIVADFDANGYLSLNGQRGLWLYTGTWQVSFAAALGWTPYQITVTTDHTTAHPLDLWTAAGWQPPDASAPTVTLLVPATVHDGDVLIRAGNEVSGVPQSAFTGPAGPRGVQGPPGPAGQPSTLTGTGVGRPDMPATLDQAGRTWTASAPIGALWIPTDAPQKTFLWQKLATGWTVVYGDTGIMDVTKRQEYTNFITAADGSLTPTNNIPVTIRRYGNIVCFDASVDHTKTGVSILDKPLPSGFRVRFAFNQLCTNTSINICNMFFNASSSNSNFSGPVASGVRLHAEWITDERWPATL
ncbi:hypothetical protein FYJ43_04305 [Cutibacterium sp. WCA-380-WT-3A]|uniref:Collagen-like protein n=1 Tax=Cutibacterium porci TaxID=2605781 RepID=A0A7K0J5S3_9ACTN|nr:hypothetical protein [Cutibacterium porci]MSS45279.1 hypothetical protein [Cutibacterium porci]